MIKISRCMSTQHPDNISMPFFSDNDVIAGETEVKEAFYVFSQLGCREQMWDSEGKEVDNQVVEKLLSKYTDYFKVNKLGKEIFLTYRVPNPAVEKEQGKILLETLHSIPRAFDAAKVLNQEIAPIFEVIVPMTTSSVQIEMVKQYYEKVIVGQNNTKIGKKTVKEWVGEFRPDSINVIPLFEDFDSLSNGAEIVGEYLKGKELEYQRVFLARSDPALNYGSASAVLMAKCALFDLQVLQEKTSVEILPIIGVGSAPFRGNFRPDNVMNCGEEYPSVQTFTAQSSFKYDHQFRDVFNAIDMLNYSKRGAALVIDKKLASMFIRKIKDEYEKQISTVPDLINKVSSYVPARRARKLHVGLFGYARSLKGIKLPRAIKFCAAFYSIGLPPELLGLSGLNEKEFDKLHELYNKIDEDLKESAKFLNIKNLHLLPKEIQIGVKKVLQFIEYEEDEAYCDVTGRILNNLRKEHDATISEDVKRAAWMRKFLG
ncbi:phosphoenolpyruvate carboxylase [Candidatus Micrarchaeota archaeon]|nr:phosphoenolpyruvate carboxylase [Candidatus Micrarchaeota archaeon]